MKTLGENIRHYRERTGLTQTELAYRLNVSDGAVSAWESGRNRPKYDLILLLATELRCTVRDLYRGTQYEAVFGSGPNKAVLDAVPTAEVRVKPQVRVEGKTIHVELEPVQAFQLSAREQQLVAYFRIMSKAQQESFVSMAKSMVEK